MSHKLLRRFRPFAALDSERLELIQDLIQVQSGTPGEVLFELGSRDPHSYFLLSGTVELESADGRKLRVSAGEESALIPLSELRPRRYRAQAHTEVRFFRVDTAVWQTIGHSDSSPDGVVVDQDKVGPLSPEDAASLLCERIRSDLESDHLVLPTLPDIAVRLNRAIRDERTDSAGVAGIIQLDPSITAKVIKVANSAFYGGLTPVKSCKEAVVRLGLDATHSLVLSFVMREVFKANTAHIRQRMKALWEHSVRVAAISYVLAGITRKFGPERVLLAGLVHDIGVVPLLSYADEIPELSASSEQLDAIVSQFRGRVGGKLLATWGFSPALVTVAERAEEWNYDGGPEADYCDLVIVAQLHSFIGEEPPREVPALDGLPAFRKLFPESLAPKDSIKLLRRAADKLAQIEAPLRGG